MPQRGCASWLLRQPLAAWWAAGVVATAALPPGHAPPPAGATSIATPAAAVAAAAAPVLLEPANASSTPLSHPHFMWVAPTDCAVDTVVDGDARACTEYVIQLASDPTFTTLLVPQGTVDAVVNRFVPLHPLPTPATAVWWRVGVRRPGAHGSGKGKGTLSFSDPALLTLSSAAPRRVFRVAREGATFESVRAVVAAAAAAATRTPGSGNYIDSGSGEGGGEGGGRGAASAAVVAAVAAEEGGVRVEFEPGDYFLVPPPKSAAGDYTPLIELVNVSDVVVDGAGANVTFRGQSSGGFPTFVVVESCRRVEVRDFTFDIVDPLPYTALTVSSVVAAGAASRHFDDDTTAAAAASLHRSGGGSDNHTDGGGGYFEGVLVPAHPELEVLLPVLDGKASVMDADSRTGPRTKRGAFEVLLYGGIERLPAALAAPGGAENGRAEGGLPTTTTTATATNSPSYRVNLTQPFAGLAPGDTVVFDPRIAGGFRVDNSSEVVLARVVVHACANECFCSEATDRLSILGCGLVRRPGRLLAANNGGHNHHSARVGQWIEGGVFENAGDDTIHVSGLVMSVAALGSAGRRRGGAGAGVERRRGQAAAPGVGGGGPGITGGIGGGGGGGDGDDDEQAVVYLQPSYPAVFSREQDGGRLQLAPGDRLDFFDRARGALVVSRTVVAVDAGAPQRLHPGQYPATRVTLDEALPLDGSGGGGGGGGVVPGTIGGGPLNASVTQVFNSAAESSQLVVRGNVLRNGRRVGVLAKGHRALVENNTFVGLGGGAVELWNAPYEGLCAQSYVVQGNTIEDTNQLLRQAAPGLWAEAFATGGPYSCHRDILFRNNSVAAGPGSAFVLGATAGVVFDGNNVTRCVSDPLPVVEVTEPNVHGVVFRANNTITNRSDAWLCDKK